MKTQNGVWLDRVRERGQRVSGFAKTGALTAPETPQPARRSRVTANDDVLSDTLKAAALFDLANGGLGDGGF